MGKEAQPNLADLVDESTLNTMRAAAICVSLVCEDNVTRLNDHTVTCLIDLVGELSDRATEQIYEIHQLHKQQLADARK